MLCNRYLDFGFSNRRRFSDPDRYKCLGLLELVGLARRGIFLGALWRRLGGEVNARAKTIRLTDEERLDWLRLIRSQNVGPRTSSITSARRASHLKPCRHWHAPAAGETDPFDR